MQHDPAGSDPSAPREALVATIDIGTNSVLLLVARAGADGELTPVEELATITRLGEGVDRSRELAPAAIERTLACLERYAEVIAKHGAGAVDVVGTSAMRDARGGEAFRESARALLGVAPRIISGDEEARLTFAGGLSSIPVAGEVIVFDIGGGSTELIRGDAASARIDSAISLDVGSVRLTERHVKSDPPSVAELAAIDRDIDATLARGPDLTGAKLVGVAGTVTTLAAIALGVDPYDAARLHGASLTLDQVQRTCVELARIPLAERVRLPGLSPKRADVIIAGSRLCRSIIERANAGSLVVSDRGVRWGLAAELGRKTLA